MATKAMKFRHRQFLKLYLGQTPIAGNATQCYKAVYGDHVTERSAQVSGARLLQLPHVKDAIEKANAKAIEELAVDAGFVLKESLRLYQRAMGDDSYDHVKVDTDPDTGAERVSVRSERSYDPATAHKALQAIGQHRDVQAFTQTVEHTHTHVLEQRLAARSKMIEGRAAQVLDQLPGDPADLASDPAAQVATHNNDECLVAGDVPGYEEARTEGAGDSKRVHIGGGQSGRGIDPDVSSSEREGATAK